MDSNNKILSLWDTLPEEIQHIILTMAFGLEHKQKYQQAIMHDFALLKFINNELVLEMARTNLDDWEFDHQDHMHWEWIVENYEL